MVGTPTGEEPRGIESSITDPRTYLNQVMQARRIELPSLPDTCVVTYCKGLLEHAVRERECVTLDLGVTVPTHLHVVEPGSPASYCLVAGRPGSPMAAVLLEELIELGLSRFLVLGSAGHPANGRGEVRFGEVVVPDRSYVYEGTSRHYGVTGPSVPVDADLRLALESALRAEGIPYRSAPAATTDAFYRETPELVRELLSLDVAALEMELSALLSVACFRQRALAAILCISDVIHLEGEWHIGLTSREYEAVHERMLPVIERVIRG